MIRIRHTRYQDYTLTEYLFSADQSVTVRGGRMVRQTVDACGRLRIAVLRRLSDPPVVLLYR